MHGEEERLSDQRLSKDHSCRNVEISSVLDIYTCLKGSGEILYEENGLRSLISCSPNSSGIIGENSGLLPWEKDD